MRLTIISKPLFPILCLETAVERTGQRTAEDAWADSIRAKGQRERMFTQRVRLRSHHLSDRRAFTLTELLVVIGILMLLGCLVIGGIPKIYESVRQTRETHAARTLILAFHRYAIEHNGTFFNGNNNKEDAWNLAGKKLSHTPPIATRYPWRLLPYIDADLDTTILVNQDLDIARDESGKIDDYYVSVFPSLAMNISYIGSEREVRNRKGEILGYNPYTVNRIEQVQNPNDLIVFTSAGAYEALPNDLAATPRQYWGYWYAKAPYDAMTRAEWPQAIDSTFPLLGNVHFRWNGKAVTVSLSGAVQLLTPDQLRDMRRWSNQAAVDNNPHWTPHLKSQPVID